jgi:pimeloyl-ACP methyl ester carboxylesterase
MELYYRKSGTGPNLIILHGLFGSSDNWMSITKKLSESFTVWLPDQRNHGQSPHSGTFTYAAMAEDLKDFIDQHDIENPHILGHSMGGKVVMEYATSFKSDIDHLIVADIAPKAYPLHHEEILEGLNSIEIDKIKARSEAQKQLEKYVSDFGTRAFLLKNIYRKDNGSYAWRINLPVLTKDIANVGMATGQGKQYDGDTLFIRGEKSHYVEDTDFETIKNIFTNAQFSTVHAAGHWLHAEQPEAFLKDIMSFLT